MFSVIVPAFDERETIADVVRSIRGIPGSELIVVDDGSTDGTAEVARQAGAEVLRLDRNRGKGHALDAGIARARHDRLVFVDADVGGMNEEKIYAMVRPVEEGAVMSVGVRHATFHHLNQKLRWVPVIAKLSGQRCIERRLWERARDHCRGYRVESALNYFASRMGEISYVYLPGLTHRIKEEKRGLLHGGRQRLKMICHIVASTIAVRTSRHSGTLDG